MFEPSKDFKEVDGMDNYFVVVHFDPFDVLLACLMIVLGIGLLINSLIRKNKKDK